MTTQNAAVMLRCYPPADTPQLLPQELSLEDIAGVDQSISAQLPAGASTAQPASTSASAGDQLPSAAGSCRVIVRAFALLIADSDGLSDGQLMAA